MAPDFSNKKVSRAARTGGSSIRTGSRPVGYYTILAVIVVLGVALITFSRNERLNATSPGRDRPYAPWTNELGQPMEGDSWTEAYGVYLCDKFADGMSPQIDESGLTTNNDGIIHIAPKTKKYAGRNATLGLFAKGAGIAFTRDSVQMPGGQLHKVGQTNCGDKKGKLVIREWEKAADKSSGKTIKADPNDVLVKDKAAITVAFVPEDTKDEDIPMPASVEKMLNPTPESIPGEGAPAPLPPAAN